MNDDESVVFVSPEVEPLVVDDRDTMAKVCHRALLQMLEQQGETCRVNVLYKGMLYYFDLRCLGYKPPYEITPDTKWFGQEPN